MTEKRKNDKWKEYSPASETHRMFLNCTSKFVIFGGGA